MSIPYIHGQYLIAHPDNLDKKPTAIKSQKHSDWKTLGLHTRGRFVQGIHVHVIFLIAN